MFTWYRRYFDFAGRSSRKEYWLGILCFILLAIAAMIIDIVAFHGVDTLAATEGGLSGPAYGLLMLGSLIPSLALGVRRMHDLGKTGWWMLLGLIPLVGGLILIIWALQRGQATANRFGAAPPETPGLTDSVEAAA